MEGGWVRVRWPLTRPPDHPFTHSPAYPRGDRRSWGGGVEWLRLTGKAATDPSDASGTLMADVLSGTWAIALLEALNLRTDWLPPIVASRAIAGTLTQNAAEHLGCPPTCL